MRRRLKLIGAAVAALGLPLPALADATLPSLPQPAVDEDASGKADAEPPIACGSPRGKFLQKALAAFCAKTSDDLERAACAPLLRAFRRCRRLEIDNSYEQYVRATVSLPNRPNHEPLYATASFAREQGGYRVFTVEQWEDCP